MPLLGAHMSIAGGCHKAVEAAVAEGMETVQLFTKNNNRWVGKPLGAEDVDQFSAAIKASSLKFPMAHDCYLINFASPDPVLYQKSLDAFIDEVQRAEKLGLAYLVTHPGAPTDGDVEAGLRRVSQGLDEVHRQTPGFRVQVLLETTAGQGKALGWRFEELASILDQVADPDRLGVCLDTCHVFAAGYDLRTEGTYQQTMAEFDRIVGFDKLRAFHVNDSKKPLGSRVDRHDHIGKGMLGLEAFRLLVNDPRFADRPMVLETPKEDEVGEETMDKVNLATLRSLLTENRSPKMAETKKPRAKR
ncbi:MAG: deoxyribonuclease IV [Gemmataceae bacterium]